MNNSYLDYMIPTEIKSDILLGKGIYFVDAAFMVVAYLLCDNLKFLVHPVLQLPYIIGSLLISFLLTRPSRANPTKRMYHELIFSIKKDVHTYRREGVETNDEFEEVICENELY